MTLDVCCLVLTLLSANVSDLTQTAHFTQQGGRVTELRTGSGRKVGERFEPDVEGNPLARPLVQSPDARGEMALAAFALVSAYQLERWNNWQAQAVMLAWTVLHVSAVLKNQEKHPEVSIAIMFPVFIARW